MAVILMVIIVIAVASSTSSSAFIFFICTTLSLALECEKFVVVPSIASFLDARMELENVCSFRR